MRTNNQHQVLGEAVSRNVYLLGFAREWLAHGTTDIYAFCVLTLSNSFRVQRSQFFHGPAIPNLILSFEVISRLVQNLLQHSYSKCLERVSVNCESLIITKSVKQL